MRSVHVYAAAGNVPLTVCFDARLRAEDRTQSETYGQVGWHWGVNFGTLHQLALTLTDGTTDTPPHTCGNSVFDCDPLAAGEVKILGILAHGVPGMVDVDSKCSGGQWGTELPDTIFNELMRVSTLKRYHTEFALLDKALAANGTLFFFSCRAGQGDEGTDLLVEVSRLLPGREIIAYNTIGYASGSDQLRPGKGCNEPGMRETKLLNPIPDTATLDAHIAPLWNDLDALPWAAYGTPFAKHVKDGVVLRSGNPAED